MSESISKQQRLKERFFEQIGQIRYQEGLEKAKGFGVSVLAFPCLRRNFFYYRYGQFYDLRSLLRMWIGSTVHKFEWLPKTEFGLEWKPEGLETPIVAYLDQYDPETGLLVEVKTRAKMFGREKEEIWTPPHYHTQLEYQALLLQKCGYKFSEAWLQIIDIGESPQVEFVPGKLRPWEEIESELVSRAKQLEQALKQDMPPPRTMSWGPRGGDVCAYCEFSSLCFLPELPKPYQPSVDPMAEFRSQLAQIYGERYQRALKLNPEVQRMLWKDQTLTGLVQSESDSNEYYWTLISLSGESYCECKDAATRGTICKHQIRKVLSALEAGVIGLEIARRLLLWR